MCWTLSTAEVYRTDCGESRSLFYRASGCNTGISQFWEYSASGFKPVDETNEAYKLGVNDVMYGLTHRAGTSLERHNQVC
jgi:hypothetical protein